MFERFTDSARQVVVGAQEQARLMGHQQVGTEHLLLGLATGADSVAQALRERGCGPEALRSRVLAALGEGAGAGDDGDGAGLDADALATLGIDLDTVRRAVEREFGPGALNLTARQPGRGRHVRFTKRARKVLELSLREALRLGHRHIDAGHILLGLIRDGDGLAVAVLLASGVDLAALRELAERLAATRAA